jgi:hypothetical protein
MRNEVYHVAKNAIVEYADWRRGLFMLTPEWLELCCIRIQKDVLANVRGKKK